MASVFDRIAARLGYARPAQRTQLRRFDGAVVDRLTASWRAEGTSIDRELRADLDRLRHRSRDLFKNNEYAKKFGRMCATNIVGQGFVLQSRPMETASKVDQRAADAVEAAWADFCLPKHCDVRGKSSFSMQCRLGVLAAARDGEGLIRLVRGSGKYGLQMQLLDIDRLDTTYNEASVNGRNSVQLGVEVDQYSRPVAYHLFRSHPNGNNDASRVRERVPADEIIHFFLPEELEQTRGIPWMHAAMRRLNDLGGYREAAVIAARIGASKMGFFKSPDGNLAPGSDGTTEGADGSEQLMTQAEPGEFGRLPPGWDFQAFDPTYPHEQFDAFNKACLRGIASAMGVSYNSLANDLEGVNFSSIRSGVLEERDNWMVLQDWFLEQVVEPIFTLWIESALLRGAIVQIGGSALPAAKLEKFAAHTFQARRWGWVDPTKDVQASILAIEAGLTTVTDVAAKSGVDYQDVLATKQREQELRKAYGIAEPVGSTTKTTAADGQATDAQQQQADANGDALKASDMTQLQRMARAGIANGRAVEMAIRVDAPPQPEPPVIHVAAPIVNVAAPDVRIENIVQPAAVNAPDVQVNVAAPEVRVENNVQPTQVTVQPADVQVTVEAVMPAQEVTVNLELPPRRTDTLVSRDSSGRVERMTQIETDVTPAA